MKITVFGSGTVDENSEEFKMAEKFGEEVARNGWEVYSGGYYGIMLAVSRGVTTNGGKSTGIIWRNYERQPNKYLTSIIVAEDYFERLKMLIESADVYVIFPGGSGTLMELATVWALSERNLLTRKLIITIGEQWRELIQLVSFYNEISYESGLTINNVSDAFEAIKLIKEYNLG